MQIIIYFALMYLMYGEKLINRSTIPPFHRRSLRAHCATHSTLHFSAEVTLPIHCSLSPRLQPQKNSTILLWWFSKPALAEARILSVGTATGVLYNISVEDTHFKSGHVSLWDPDSVLVAKVLDDKRCTKVLRPFLFLNMKFDGKIILVVR